MIRQEYINFIEKFEELNPYELDHFCRIFHQHYQAAIKKDQEIRNVSIAPGGIKEILIHVMQAVRIELAERKVKDAELNLALTKSKLHIY